MCASLVPHFLSSFSELVVVKPRHVNVPVLVASVLLCVAVFFVLLACVINGLHRVDEGHVGVYFKVNPTCIAF